MSTTTTTLQRGLSLLALAALTACGGGGGGGATGTGGTSTGGTTEQPQAVTPVTIDALPASTRALRVEVDERMADASYIESLVGGTTYEGWNLRDPRRTMVPGMRIAFFGEAADCDAGAANGPVAAGSDSEFSAARALTGMSAGAVTNATRWTPSGATSACSAAVQNQTGPNWIFLNPTSGGGFGMMTQVGPDASGNRPFLAATSAAGVDGAGYNANGLSNFVGFRQAWNAADAVRPWAVPAGGSTGEARVVSRQTLGSTDVGGGSGTVVQVKQQVMVSLINTECQRLGHSPCQIQYLFNTAIVRAGVSDWEAYAPSTSGRVWFDKAQGGLPIVAGLVPAAGATVSDTDSGLALYRSAGAASQHASFSGQPFDMRIGFAELLNAARIVAGRELGVAATAVSDTQMAAQWSTRWNDPQAWTLVSSTFGHEIYNAQAASLHSHIGGGFSTLYVGPAR